MIDEEAPVEVGDSTPSFIEQARLNGWKAGIFDFGKAEVEGVEHFNPGLVLRPDGLWLLVRRSELVDGMPYGKNSIWACQLDTNPLKPKGGPILAFPDSADDEQFEDPRAIYWNGQVWVAAVNFTWYADGSWTGAHQVLGMFQDDPDWTALARRDPPIGTNNDRAGDTGGRHNKNWVWFFHEDKLHVIYQSDPWQVIELGSTWEEQTPYSVGAVKWKYGMARGGTPPVRVGDYFFTFFHSSLPWRGRFRRYFMGVVAFEARPPFNPVLWSHAPLLSGSQNDPWHQGKPLVVFPCGAIFENDRWLISLGVNDLKAGWVQIPHEDVMRLAQPAPPSPAKLLLGMATTKPERAAIPFVREELETPPAAIATTGAGSAAASSILPPEKVTTNTSPPPGPEKRGRGRPKGSKNRPKKKTLKRQAN